MFELRIWHVLRILCHDSRNFEKVQTYTDWYSMMFFMCFDSTRYLPTWVLKSPCLWQNQPLLILGIFVFLQLSIYYFFSLSEFLSKPNEWKVREKILRGCSSLKRPKNVVMKNSNVKSKRSSCAKFKNASKKDSKLHWLRNRYEIQK